MENLLTSFQTILAHKLRSILTILGVIIGVAAIISIFSIIEGNTESIKQQLIGGKNNVMTIQYDQAGRFDRSFNKASEDIQKTLYLPEITDELMEKIKAIPDVSNASQYYESHQTLIYQKASEQTTIYSVPENYFTLNPLTIVGGEIFFQKGLTGGSAEIILSEPLFVKLFPNRKLGNIVEINNQPFKVIGFFKPNSSTVSIENEMSAYLPFNQYHKLQNEINVTPSVAIQATDTESLKKAAEMVAETLTSYFPKSDYIFGIDNLDNYSQQIETYNRSNFFLLAGIASISLLVGGIGVMNIMLVSVSERTKEIGIKKALGARKSCLLRQFLQEAVILTLTGGFLGILIGLITGFVVTWLLGYPFMVSLLSIFGSLIFCSLVGIIFGIFPAFKAANLDPVEALRYE